MPSKKLVGGAWGDANVGLSQCNKSCEFLIYSFKCRVNHYGLSNSQVTCCVSHIWWNLAPSRILSSAIGFCFVYLWGDKNEKWFQMKILVKSYMVLIYQISCTICRPTSRFWDHAISTYLGHAGFCLNMLSLYLCEAQFRTIWVMYI